MKSFHFDAVSEADTDRLGAAIAELLPDGAVVALSGTLGAGKTRLVQAVAAALGVERELVTSPTFVLCQTYVGRRTIHHFDVYRLKDDEEFLQLGPEEYFESGALCFVEWADRVADLLPPAHLVVDIQVAGPTQRRFALEAGGPLLERSLEQVALRLSSSIE